MMDTFNLGWKLASVIRHQASPEILRTCRRSWASDCGRQSAEALLSAVDQVERRAVASDLIGMHGVWSAINAKVAAARTPEEVGEWRNFTSGSIAEITLFPPVRYLEPPTSLGKPVSAWQSSCQAQELCTRLAFS